MEGEGRGKLGHACLEISETRDGRRTVPSLHGTAGLWRRRWWRFRRRRRRGIPGYLYIWPGLLEDGTQIMPGAYEVRGTLAYPQYADDWRANDEWATPIRKINVTN